MGASFVLDHARGYDLLACCPSNRGERELQGVATEHTGRWNDSLPEPADALPPRAAELVGGQSKELTERQYQKRRLGSGRALPVTFAREATEGWLLVACHGLLGSAPNEKLMEAWLEGPGVTAFGHARGYADT